jgi:signal transduction histidine kinase
MQFDVTPATGTELAAPLLQLAITLGLTGLSYALFVRYRKQYFRSWALAWVLYALRLAAIISFMITTDRVWLYWHQVVTGWTALAFLWAALVFSQDVRWRAWYVAVLLFPPLWSFVAIYQLDNFLLAAGPAVLFLSLATVWTGWVFLRYHRQVGSTGAALLGIALFLWSLHHLDYPFFRARGAWNPWGYYIDIAFELIVVAGLLLLVLEDLQRGLGALSGLSADLQRHGDHDGLIDALVERPMSLPAVRGSAMFSCLPGADEGRFVGGAGICRDWVGSTPSGPAQTAIDRAVRQHRPEIARAEQRWSRRNGYAYAAAIPVLRDREVAGAMVIVGEARDPFAALDSRFLVTLGHQVGAAIENADLYHKLESRKRELEQLATRMVQQREEERLRLSRELHDETAQVFSAVKMQLGVLRESALEENVAQFDRVLDLVDEGIQSIRNVTHDLRPSLLDDLGLVPALKALVADFEERGGLDVSLDINGALVGLTDEMELALFRAVQEGLANVVSHAEAEDVLVRLAVGRQEVRLDVEDDGLGPPDADHLESAKRNGHMGLAGMRERIAALGGTVHLSPRDEGGTHLAIRIPADGGAPA